MKKLLRVRIYRANANTITSIFTQTIIFKYGNLKYDLC
jgi:hypothetical protein